MRWGRSLRGLAIEAASLVLIHEALLWYLDATRASEVLLGRGGAGQIAPLVATLVFVGVRVVVLVYLPGRVLAGLWWEATRPRTGPPSPQKI